MIERRAFEVVVVGAGPAGLAAARAAAGARVRVGLVDDQPQQGGQIWRATRSHRSPAAEAVLPPSGNSLVSHLQSTRIVARTEPNTLLGETPTGSVEIQFQRLILACGARERFLPFPGWTLPGVMGAGGLQALAKGGWPVAGKQVVVAGSGPLLLAVADYLSSAGAKVAAIAEQASTARLRQFLGQLALRFPGKLLQGLALRTRLLRIPYWTSCWPVEAQGTAAVTAVRLRNQAGRLREIPCDYLACGFGLVPSSELAQLLGCQVDQGCVAVDQRMQTSVPGVFAAGEITGIGGLDKSLIEGHIAGLTATGTATDSLSPWLKKREAALRFAQLLDTTFALRPELKELPRHDTLVCRCEDVALGELRRQGSWRESKLQTRCGMGPCQGRVCGPITEFLLGWPMTSVRPPVLPARLSTLCSQPQEATSP